MPPIGRERSTRIASPEEQQRDLAIKRRTQVVHDTMLGIKLARPKTPWWRVSPNPKSAIATYALPDEPEHIQMTAWLEKGVTGLVCLNTQLVSTLSGEAVPVSEERTEAYVGSAGRLSGWGIGMASGEEENRLQAIQETLELIQQATQQHLEREVGASALSGK